MSWHSDAKCAGDTLTTYVLDQGPGKVVAHQRDVTAARLCTGCPVARDCLAEARQYGDVGVVRGGRWLNQPANYISPHRYGRPLSIVA